MRSAVNLGTVPVRAARRSRDGEPNIPNRNLTPEELDKANALLADVRARLVYLADGDAAALFAYRRKIAKELTYDERRKPMYRRALKANKMVEQMGLCPRCKEPLPEKYAVLDRLDAIGGYTVENTRLLCPKCDAEVQAEREFR
jgi:hypothetical protein